MKKKSKTMSLKIVFKIKIFNDDNGKLFFNLKMLICLVNIKKRLSLYTSYIIY